VVDMAVVSLQLDSMRLKVFSDLNDSVVYVHISTSDNIYTIFANGKAGRFWKTRCCVSIDS